MMTSIFKRSAALALSLALLGGLSSCGEPSSGIQTLDKPEAQPEYLSFFSSNSLSGSDVGKYWSEQFAQTYDKTVYVDYDGASYYADGGLSYREILETRLDSSIPDDLYIIKAEDVLDFERKGYWMDLSGMDFVQNLSDAALYQSTYNGKVFSVPLVLTGFGFYWNADLLQAHGLTIPETLDEFLAVCESLKSAGILPYGGNKGYALTVPAMCVGLAELYASEEREALIADLNSGATPISTYLRKGFAFLQLLIDKGYMDPQQAMATVPNDEWQLLLDGGCAFICAGMGAVYQDSQRISLKGELTGLPVLADGSVAVYGADSRLCVNPNSKNLATALEFIEMVGSTQALDTSAQLDHVMSTARDSQIVSASAEVKLVGLLQRGDQIPNQDFALHFNTWESIRNVCREICDGLSLDDACAKLDQLQRDELAEYAVG